MKAIFSSGQLAALSSVQIAAIETSDLQQLSTAVIRNLTTAQVQALTTEQVQALTGSQVVALSTTQLANLSTAQVVALDAATGKEHYLGARLGRASTIHASPIVAADRLYIASREGVVTVVRAGDEFEVLATNALDDVFDATPAIVDREIFLRGRSHLYCIAESN